MDATAVAVTAQPNPHTKRLAELALGELASSADSLLAVLARLPRFAGQISACPWLKTRRQLSAGEDSWGSRPDALEFSPAP